MQVTETKSEGLKREYAITVSAADLDAKTTEKLTEVRKDFQMKGFRKGKAPLPLLKKMFGKSVLGEVVQETVESSVAAHLEESGNRPAQQPEIKIANENFDEGDDLNVEVAYDCLPEVPEVDYAAISLERKVVEVDDSAVEEAMGRLAENAVEYSAVEREAAEKDQVVIDFLGKIIEVRSTGGPEATLASSPAGRGRPKGGGGGPEGSRSDGRAGGGCGPGPAGPVPSAGPVLRKQ